MVKDYNANSTSVTNGVESEDEEDPRTPTSVSSSQGYDSAGSDFVDIEGFTAIPDSSLPELNLQVRRRGVIFPKTAAVGSAVTECYATYVLHKLPGLWNVRRHQGRGFPLCPYERYRRHDNGQRRHHPQGQQRLLLHGHPGQLRHCAGDNNREQGRRRGDACHQHPGRAEAGRTEGFYCAVKNVHQPSKRTRQYCYVNVHVSVKKRLPGIPGKARCWLLNKKKRVFLSYFYIEQFALHMEALDGSLIRGVSVFCTLAILIPRMRWWPKSPEYKPDVSLIS